MSDIEEDLNRQIEDLKAQLASEKATAKKGIYLQVSKKGGVSLYGIRRYPVTFYLEEGNRIVEMEPDIRKFLAEHESDLPKSRTVPFPAIGRGISSRARIARTSRRWSNEGPVSLCW